MNEEGNNKNEDLLRIYGILTITAISFVANNVYIYVLAMLVMGVNIVNIKYIALVVIYIMKIIENIKSIYRRILYYYYEIKFRKYNKKFIR